MSKSAATQQHTSFEVKCPIAYRQLITPIQILAAHMPGEEPMPFPGNFKALWDTGATNSTISTKLAAKFPLPVIGEREMHGAGGAYTSKSFLAGLLLPNNVLIQQIVLYGFNGSPNFDILIGMDIIALGDFLVSSHKGETYFSFQVPSVGGITLRSIKPVNGQPIVRQQKKVCRNAPCPCGSGKKYKQCCGR